MPKTKTQTKYGWRESRHLGGDAQVVGERIEVLKAEMGGKVKPVDIVSDATSKKSPLHRYFEWDDNEAAHRYRLRQARNLVQSLVTIEVVYKGSPVETKIAFVSVRDGGEAGYVATIEAMSDEGRREEVLEQARSDLRSIRLRLAIFKECADAVDSIDDALENLKPKRKRKK